MILNTEIQEHVDLWSVAKTIQNNDVFFAESNGYSSEIFNSLLFLTPQLSDLH